MAVIYMVRLDNFVDGLEGGQMREEATGVLEHVMDGWMDGWMGAVWGIWIRCTRRSKSKIEIGVEVKV